MLESGRIAYAAKRGYGEIFLGIQRGLPSATGLFSPVSLALPAPPAEINSLAACRTSAQADCGARLCTRRRMASRWDGSIASARERITASALRSPAIRFAQHPAGKNMVVAERIEGVDEHDVQIPGQAAML